MDIARGEKSVKGEKGLKSVKGLKGVKGAIANAGRVGAPRRPHVEERGMGTGNGEWGTYPPLAGGRDP